MPGIPFIKDFKFDYGTAMEVTPLIRRVVANNPSPFTFKGTGTYIIGHGKVAIVDPGPDQQDHIDAVLRAVRGETVTHILVTHTHIDHVPATPALAKATGAKVYSYGPHPRPPAGVTTEQEGDLLLRARHQAERRRRRAGRRLERRGGLHARPHLQPSLLRGEGRQGAALGRPRHGLVDGGDLAARRQHGRLLRVSLRKLLPRDETLYIPTHGAEIRNPNPFVQAYIEHRLGREAQIMARLKEGPQTIPQMVAKNYADTPIHLHAAAGRSMLAHLVQMVKDGRVKTEDGRATIDSIYRL